MRRASDVRQAQSGTGSIDPLEPIAQKICFNAINCFLNARSVETAIGSRTDRSLARRTVGRAEIDISERECIRIKPPRHSLELPVAVTKPNNDVVRVQKVSPD